MYLSFFGLGENPFGLTPDPRFLFMAASHREALDQLREQRGLVVLTGEPGTGKTALLLALCEQLDAATLAQLGLLVNLDSAAADTRLQLLLAGSPELEARLQDPDLRHLRESIAVHCQIRPLDAGEVAQYIHHRLKVAGAPDVGLFEEGAIARLARFSRGIPRVINILADHCLLLAYADQKRRVDRRTAGRAIANVTEGAQAPLRLVAAWTTLASSLAEAARRLFARRG